MYSVRRSLSRDFKAVIRSQRLPNLYALYAYVHPTTEVPNPLLHARNHASLQRSKEREALRAESGILNSCAKKLSFD